MVQNLVGIKFDSYTRKARIAPTLIVLLPLLITILAISPSQYVTLGGLAGLLVWGSGTALLAEIGRELGKKKEPELYELWDGKPTTQMLRHRNATNTVILARKHTKLQQLLPDLKIPTAAEEEENQESSDDIYEACAAFLRNNTRNHDQFPLVFEELCNYGFRRNLWGMKPIGLITSTIGTVIVAIFIIINLFVTDFPSSLTTIVGGLVNIVLLLLWYFLITTDWVKTAAYAYAERLLDSCEQL